MPHFMTEWIADYGAWGYFPIIYLESMGFPLPGESGLIIGSLLAARGKLQISILLIAAFTGSVLGDCTGYAIGRWGGQKLLHKIAGWSRIKPQQIDKFKKIVNQKGIWFVMFARFVVVARQLNGLVAGAAGRTFPHFLVANIIGAALWTLVWGLGPYLLHHLTWPLA